MKHTYTHARRRAAAIGAALALVVSGALVSGSAASAAPPVTTAVTAPAAAATKKVYTTTADLNLRKSPSTSGTIITTLKKGTKVTVIGTSGSWRKVTVGKRTGWVSGKFLKAVIVKTTPTVKISSRTKTNVSLGAKLTINGATSKSLTGKTVALQIKSGGSWSTIKKTTVTSKQKFTLTVKATQAGRQSYRVYAPSTKTTKAAASATFKYTVWSWYDIAGTDVDDYRAYQGAVKIGGVNFDRSVYFDQYTNAYWADYNVSYKCTKFRATIGMDDDSKTGAERTFSLGVDSTTVNLGTRGIGKGLQVSVDITDANRIRLNTSANGNGVIGYPAFGTPQVFCSSAP